MPDRTEQGTMKEVSNLNRKNDPFKNLEEVLSQLGNLNSTNLIELTKEVDYVHTASNNEILPFSDLEEIIKPTSDLNEVLTELRDIFTVCTLCHQRTLKDELIKGLCFQCYQKREQINAENEEIIAAGNEGDLIPLISRLGDLTAKVEDIKTEPKEIKLSKETMEQLIGTILETVRKDIKSELNINRILADFKEDIQAELNILKRNLSKESSQTPSGVINVPSPPPPPSGAVNVSPPPPPPSHTSNSIPNDSLTPIDVNFLNMTLEELKTFTPEILESLPLIKRKQYTLRLKELHLIEQMTPEEKEAYCKKKKEEEEQSNNVELLKDSLKNLAESGNSLFMKMRDRANGSILAGQGTLGVIGPKLLFIPCYKCNETNEIIEGEEAICKNCRRPLNKR